MKNYKKYFTINKLFINKYIIAIMTAALIDFYLVILLCCTFFTILKFSLFSGLFPGSQTVYLVFGLYYVIFFQGHMRPLMADGIVSVTQAHQKAYDFFCQVESVHLPWGMYRKFCSVFRELWDRDAWNKNLKSDCIPGGFPKKITPFISSLNPLVKHQSGVFQVTTWARHCGKYPELNRQLNWLLDFCTFLALTRLHPSFSPLRILTKLLFSQFPLLYLSWGDVALTSFLKEPEPLRQRWRRLVCFRQEPAHTLIQTHTQTHNAHSFCFKHVNCFPSVLGTHTALEIFLSFVKKFSWV